MLIISDADDVTARCKQRAAYVNKVESSLSKRPLPCRELNLCRELPRKILLTEKEVG